MMIRFYLDSFRCCVMFTPFYDSIVGVTVIETTFRYHSHTIGGPLSTSTPGTHLVFIPVVTLVGGCLVILSSLFVLDLCEMVIW